MQKKILQEGRIRMKRFFLKKKSYNTLKRVKMQKKSGPGWKNSDEKIFFGEKKVLESSETCKNAKKEWSRMVEFGRKNFLLGKKKVLESSETCKDAKKSGAGW